MKEYTENIYECPIRSLAYDYAYTTNEEIENEEKFKERINQYGGYNRKDFESMKAYYFDEKDNLVIEYKGQPKKVLPPIGKTKEV